MPALIPINAVDKVINDVVWRFSVEESKQLDCLVFLAPHARLVRLMQIITVVAKRDDFVRKILATPGVIPHLKAMGEERRQLADLQGGSEVETIKH